MKKHISIRALSTVALLGAILLVAPSAHAQSSTDGMGGTGIPSTTVTSSNGGAYTITTVYTYPATTTVTSTDTTSSTATSSTATTTVVFSGGTPTYSGGILYDSTGVAVTGAGMPIPVNGVYYTDAGAAVYYRDGWYYYPIATTNSTVEYYPIATIPGATVLTTTVVPGNIDITGTDTVFTPGVPNTGAGGFMTVNILTLLVSAGIALGGLVYLSRRVLYR